MLFRIAVYFQKNEDGMVRFALRLADVLIDVTVQHDYARNFCNDWITDSSESTDSRLTITVTQDDIDSERAEACKEYAKGRPRVAAPDTYGDDYLEILSLYRKIAEALTARNILLFHGSVVAVDDQTYVSITDGRNTSILSWFSVSYHQRNNSVLFADRNRYNYIFSFDDIRNLHI